MTTDRPRPLILSSSVPGYLPDTTEAASEVAEATARAVETIRYEAQQAADVASSEEDPTAASLREAADALEAGGLTAPGSFGYDDGTPLGRVLTLAEVPLADWLREVESQGGDDYAGACDFLGDDATEEQAKEAGCWIVRQYGPRQLAEALRVADQMFDLRRQRIVEAAKAAFAEEVEAFKQATARFAGSWDEASELSEAATWLGESYGPLPSFDELAATVAGWEVQ